MNSQTFHWEIRTILGQFEQAFNDIVINRYNKDREEKDKVHVNFRYSPKTRTLHEIVQKNQHFKMPVASVSVGSIQRDVKRVFNKHDGSSWSDTQSVATSAWAHLLQPVPVNVTVNMSIVARFQADIDQILTNFIPYCNPYIVVSWKWPDIIPFADFEIRSTIKWSEDVQFEYPIDIVNTAPYRVIANTTFVLESWMFKNMPELGKPIYVIDTSFSSMTAIEEFDVMKNYENDDNTDYNTDYTVISARPQFTNAIPSTTYSDQKIDLYGDMFDHTNSVYVSTNDWTMFDTTSSSVLSAGLIWSDPMSGTRFVSAFPAFSGIEIPDTHWNIISNNVITFTSLATLSGFYDIIALNSAGYGILSQDCTRPISNPYAVGSVEYGDYVEPQLACISGIEVKQV